MSSRYFSALPMAAKAYVCGVVILGAAVLCWRVSMLPRGLHTGEMLLVVLALMIGTRTVKIASNVELSGVLPVIVAALLAIGVAGALDVAIASMVATCCFRRNPIALHRTLFNASALLSATFAAGVAYRFSCTAMSGHPVFPRTLVAVFAAIVVFYILNTGMVATAIGLATRSSIPAHWKNSFSWTIVSYLAAGSLGVMGAKLMALLGMESLLLLLPAAALILKSYHLHVERTTHRQKCQELDLQLKQETSKRLTLEGRIAELMEART